MTEQSNNDQKHNDSKKQSAKKIQVDMDEQIAQGLYSNMTICSVNQEEFVLDFAYLQPALTKGKVRSRVILNPKNAKRLAQLLGTNVAQYEEKFGQIQDKSTFPSVGFSVN